ncbi:MAG: tetratricopeptide repeat protein [Pirellulales bacterium]
MPVALRSFSLKSVYATLCAACVLLLGTASVSTRVATARPDTAADLDEPPAPLIERVRRTEVDDDRLHALALFAEARTLEQNNESSAALAKYQRAFRYDPASLTTLRELLPLAFNLNRNGVAVRYAAKFADFEGGDPQMLRRLGVLLTEQGKWKQALALYEKVAAAAPGEKSAAMALLRMEMGRLYFLDERPRESSDCFVEVLRDSLSR